MNKTRHSRLLITLGVAAFILCAAGAGGFWYHQTHPPAPHRVIDPVSQVLRQHLLDSHALTPNSPVSILIEADSEQDVARLESRGVWVRFKWGRYVTATVPDRRVDELASYPEVHSLRFIGPEAGSGAPRLSGGPAIVVIDEGIDWRDQAFWSSDGPRIAYYWDQTDGRGPGPPLGPATYGTELIPTQLAALRRHPELVPSRTGHGTTMARIAAGTSSPSPGIDPAAQFMAKGTDAPIILVNTTGKDASILDALRYAIRRADELGRARVINLSIGKHFGRHDRSDPFVAALDAAVNDERTLLFVAVANDGMRRIYTKQGLEQTTAIPFVVKQADCTPGKRVSFELEGWYEDQPGLGLTLQPPHAAAARVLDGDHIAGGQAGGDHYLVDTRLRAEDGHGRGLHMTAQSDCQPRSEAVWRVAIKSDVPHGDVRLWVTHVEDCEVVFPQARGEKGAISAFAASGLAVAVGAYHIMDGRVQEADYSSEGYTGDGRWKPDVLAPSDFRVMTDSGEDHVGGGTSAATAIASRVALAIWTAHPELKASQLRAAFAGTAIVPSHSAIASALDPRYQPRTIEDTQDSIFKRQAANVVARTGGQH